MEKISPIEVIVVVVIMAVVAILIVGAVHNKKNPPTGCFNGVLYYKFKGNPTAPVYSKDGTIETCEE
jgi:hypothetical protein